MTLATKIDLNDNTSPKLYFSLIEASNGINYELSKLIEAEEYCCGSSSQLSIQDRLFLLGETANRRAMLARQRGNMQNWSIWDKIVTLLDFVCEWLDHDRTSLSYILY